MHAMAGGNSLCLRGRPTRAVWLQFQFNGAMMTALFVGMTFTICIGGDDCINFSTTWLGSPPVSFILTCLQVRPPVVGHRAQSDRENAVFFAYVLPQREPKNSTTYIILLLRQTPV